MLKNISIVLKVTGFFAIFIGLFFGFLDLKGLLINQQRKEILDWIYNSKVGMPLTDVAAKEFMKYFPPPEGEKIGNLTHLTKRVLAYEGGAVINYSVSYMRRDESWTAHVANLNDIKLWASESPYPWISWWLTLVGLIELTGTWLIEKKYK